MRSDFIELLSMFERPSLKTYLEKIPHKISDFFGNILSENDGTKAQSPEITLQIESVSSPLLKFQADSASQKTLQQVLQSELELHVSQQLKWTLSESENILVRDLETVLASSEATDHILSKTLQRGLEFLLTHLKCKSVSIISIFDGFTLEPLAAMGEEGARNPQQEVSALNSITGIVASKREPYICNNPNEDKNFQSKSSEEAPENFVCYPLLFSNSLVGILNACNKIGGEFSPENIEILRRFAVIFSHIMQNDFNEKRMQGFEKSSDQLGKYLSSKVVKNMKLADSMELGGKEKKVVCLFSDIRSFTTITEGIDAPTLVTLLNFYFERMSAVIDAHEGAIDKLVGDLIMVVWNFPNDQPNAEVLAMKTALEMQKEVIRTIAPEWAKYGIPKMSCGIGVNAGKAVVGNLGSSRFMNYTVIGDTINTAQRLEARAAGGEIWMAEAMFPEVDGKIERPLRKENGIKLKGKTQEVNAYVYRPLTF